MTGAIYAAEETRCSDVLGGEPVELTQGYFIDLRKATAVPRVSVRA
jgi:uncharacterized protein (DUF488 family)